MKLKIAKGPWRVSYVGSFLEWDPKSCPRVIDATGFDVFSQTVDHPGTYDLQLDSHAQLIADAGTTYDLCGLLPSELVERVKVLEEAMSDLLVACQLQGSDSMTTTLSMQAARTALANGGKK